MSLHFHSRQENGDPGKVIHRLQFLSVLKSSTMLIRQRCMPQVKARSAGQTVAADQLLKMANPRGLEEFKNQMMAASSSAAAQTATEAAALQLDLTSLGDRTAQVTREQSIQVRRLQRQQAASHASGPAVVQLLSLTQTLARGSEEV